MDNLKVNQDKVIMILINEIIELKANNIAIQGVLIGLTKILKPEISDLISDQLQELTEKHRQLAVQQLLSSLQSESLEMEHYLKSLICQ
jgi:hypothetical protein